MSENKDIAIGILKRLFGNPKMDSPEHVQYEFNCPSAICKNDINKFNLNFNSNKIIFNCFEMFSVSGISTKINISIPQCNHPACP